MDHPTFEDVQEGDRVLVELVSNRGTRKTTEGIVKRKISIDDSDPDGILVEIETQEKQINDYGRVRKVLDLVKKKHKIIKILPNQSRKNHSKVISLLSESDEFICIIVGYWKHNHFEYIEEALENNNNVKEIKIISGLPFLKDNSIDRKEVDKIYRDGEKFREDNKERNISLDFRFLTEKKVGRKTHDRFFFTKNQVWNFIDLDIIKRKENSRSDISDAIGNEKFETVIERDFYRYWNEDSTISIFGNGKQKLEQRISDLEKKRLEQLGKENKN